MNIQPEENTPNNCGIVDSKIDAYIRQLAIYKQAIYIE